MKTRRKTNKSRGGRPKRKSSPSSRRATSTPLVSSGAPPPSAAAAGAAGIGENWDGAVGDTVVLGPGRCAANAAERHVVLDHAVSNSWATEDIGMIQRVESNGRCMWVMWRRTSVTPI
ncbi:MAG TPA: hypothetical protein VJS65_12750 [Verrucomicrobiae bacterium]|nr:hypothetical protein [Verrucomicrobiae bacterium]